MKAFVIRKKDDELSEKLSDECISSASAFGIHVEKFNGVYENHDQLIETDKLFPNPTIIKKLRNSYKGCFLSHYLLWKKCIELNEPFLIFEHDALMINPLPDEVYHNVATILVLDKFSRDNDYENLLNLKFNLKIEKKEKIDVYSSKTMNNTHVAGSHAHLVFPDGARQVIESIKKYGYVITDVAINQIYVKYYTIEPTIARVNPFFSLGKNRQFSHMKVY